MLTRLSPAVILIILGTTMATILVPATASAGPCGVTCANASGGHHHGGSNSGGGTGGANNGGNGNTGPNTGCGGVTGQQCPPGNPAVPAPPVHIPTIDVLQSAQDQQALPVPEIHTSPNTQSYVQLETSFWINRGQFRNITTTATVPDQTVTVRAVRQSVTWNLGESTKTCTGTAATTPGSCTYIYKRSSASQPGGVYQITATINWTASWRCVGVCDTPGGNLGGATATSPPLAFPIREIQTESTPG